MRSICLQKIHISNRSAGSLCVLQNHLKKFGVVNPKINSLYRKNINMVHLRKSSHFFVYYESILRESLALLGKMMICFYLLKLF